MRLPRYSFKASRHFQTFEFVSEGPKGKIRKLIQFTPTNYSGVYNLAFGDKDMTTGEINDTVVSNNGDTEKILATVVASVLVFTQKNSNIWVIISVENEI